MKHKAEQFEMFIRQDEGVVISESEHMHALAVLEGRQSGSYQTASSIDAQCLCKALSETTACVKAKGFWAIRENLEAGKQEPLVEIAELALCMTELEEAARSGEGVPEVRESYYEKDTFASECAGFLIRVHEVCARHGIAIDLEYQIGRWYCKYPPQALTPGERDHLAQRTIYQTFLSMTEAINAARKKPIRNHDVSCHLFESARKILQLLLMLGYSPSFAVIAELRRNQAREALHGKKA